MRSQATFVDWSSSLQSGLIRAMTWLNLSELLLTLSLKKKHSAASPYQRLFVPVVAAFYNVFKLRNDFNINLMSCFKCEVLVVIAYN